MIHGASFPKPHVGNVPQVCTRAEYNFVTLVALGSEVDPENGTIGLVGVGAVPY
jgi:hypothetical protein